MFFGLHVEIAKDPASHLLAALPIYGRKDPVAATATATERTSSTRPRPISLYVFPDTYMSFSASVSARRCPSEANPLHFPMVCDLPAQKLLVMEPAFHLSCPTPPHLEHGNPLLIRSSEIDSVMALDKSERSSAPTLMRTRNE